MAQRYRTNRRNYLRMVGVTGGVTLMAGCQGARSQNTITPGTDSGFLPFEFRRDEELVGFDIDLTQEVLDRTEFELAAWTDAEFDSLPTLLTEGDIDFIAAPRAATGGETGVNRVY